MSSAGHILRAMWVATVVCAVSAPAAAATPAHATILLYHHVADDTPPSTSVTPARFELHLELLARRNVTVWPLRRLLAAVLDGSEPVPARTVAITFDDAYRSIYDTAWPELKRRGWPFSVFVNTDAVDAGRVPYMSWDQLRTLAESGVAIENHSAAHGHLASLCPKDEAAWKAGVRADLERAHRRIEAEIGQAPQVFAWPYGEDAAELQPVVGALYRFALVQRSGALAPATDPLAVPRFPLATGFDTLDRLQRAVNTRVLPVVSAETVPPRRRGHVEEPRRLVLELAGSDGFRTSGLACYSSTGQRLEARLDGLRLTVALDGLGAPGRNKVNCTAPADDGSGTWYWHSVQWLQAPRDFAGCGNPGSSSEVESESEGDSP